jgi:hypothetical protein
VGQDHEGVDVGFIAPLGNVALSQIGHPLVGVGRLELIQAGLGLLEIVILHVA